MKLLQRAIERVEHRLTSSSEHEPALKQSGFWLRAVTWTLIGTTGFSLVWLVLARTEEIAVVRGTLEPIGQVQDVRMPSGGVTKAVLVKEGQSVKAGQSLLQLDTEASAERLKNLERSLILKEKQLQAKQREKSRYLDFNASEQRTLERNIELQLKVVGKLTTLQNQGASSELQLLQERNRLQDATGRLEQTKVDQLRQIAQFDQQVQQLQSELAELRSRLVEQQMTLRYQDIRSPVDGKVFDLKPRGAGFVSQTSEPVLKIVPKDNLQALIKIPSRQIGFLHVGQLAEISIDSFPAHDFGVLEGELERISSDALPPDPSQNQPEYLFPGVVRLKAQGLKLRDGTVLPLQPGMSLEAHIKMRSVSYLQLLLGSFRDRADSLRKF